MTRFNQPLSGNEMPRFAGPNSFMRLPSVDRPDGLDVAVIGVPMDIGTSWRSGTRFGPKAIRAESTMLRPYNMGTGAAPFEALQVADLGDVAINTFDLKDSIRRIEAFYDTLGQTKPLTLGGDHTLTLPILRSLAKRHGPVGLIHIDAHADINDHMFGEQIAHGTPFRRAYEEGLIVADRTWQIGLRGTGYGADDFQIARDWGFHVRPVEGLWHRSLAPLSIEINKQMGQGPVYITYDIDSLDPAYAPGTGTPEIAGLTPPQALELIRGLSGLDIIGADLVEVSPPYDTSGNTALLGANIAYELLCLFQSSGQAD
ncbi:MAG: guanidinobutyrase [Paracoccaceae bacterium]